MILKQIRSAAFLIVATLSTLTASALADDSNPRPSEMPSYATFAFGADNGEYPYMDSGPTAIQITWASVGCVLRISTVTSPNTVLSTAGGDLRGYVVNYSRRIRTENCVISYRRVPQTRSSGRSEITIGDI